jgi:hypothetical protein
LHDEDIGIEIARAANSYGNIDRCSWKVVSICGDAQKCIGQISAAMDSFFDQCCYGRGPHWIACCPIAVSASNLSFFDFHDSDARKLASSGGD